jgi:hypothetical protein
MACLTASALFSVYMHKMEVQFPIAKICKRFGELLSGHFFIMATKAHGIVLDFVGKVKFVRKIINQVFGIVRCMRVVACNAVSLRNRSMEILTGKDLLFHIFVAGKTEVLFIFTKSLVIIGGMGEMAAKAPIFRNS